MFVSRPMLVLRRTVIIRVLLGLILLPFGLLALWGMIAALTHKPPDSLSAGICGALAAGLLLPFAYFFRRELIRETRIHEEGIAQVIGSRITELPWDEVHEVWFEAAKVQAGGLVGAAVGAAMSAASPSKDTGLDPRTTKITVRLVGESKTRLSLGSSDKGVVEALEEILSRVNPRLFVAAQGLVEQGQPAVFGPVTLSAHGVAKGRKEPIGYSEIEAFEIKGGKLRLKKRGSWLDTFAIPLKDIPNVFVMMELFQLLSGTPVTGSIRGANLARGSFL